MSISIPYFHKTILLGLLITVVAQNVHSSAVGRQGKLSKHPVLLVVSFDGFRYDYLDKTEAPNLRAIQREGVSVPFMEAQFPTKTFPNHQSIATGLYPDVHGITDNTLFDPLHGKFLSGFTDDPEFWNYREDVIPFWIRNEQGGDGRYSGCYMWAGSSQGFGNGSLFPEYYIPQYNDAVPWETRVQTVISWMTNDAKPANMVFLYHNEPDSRGHTSGTEDDMTLEEIRRVDNRSGYLVQELKSAGIYDQINLIILSDHGMNDLHQANVINTTSFADTSLFTRYGGTPVYHIKPHNAADIEPLYNSFKAASEGKNFSVYKKDEVDFLQYGNNRRIMDILLISDPGFGFEDMSRFNEHGIAGVHGYDNKSPNMTAIFMARGPLFKKGYQAQKSFRNIDLFPLFSKIMSVPLSPNNGSLENVVEFLVNPSDGNNAATLAFNLCMLILPFSLAFY